MPMGELWDLEKLAEKCKAEGRYTFFLTSAPDNVSGKLNQPWRLERKTELANSGFPGSVGSRPNALAIF